MIEQHATPGRATDTRRKLGISPAELCVIVAVISHEALFGHGPTPAKLKRLLGTTPNVYQLLAIGWLTSKEVGPIAGQTLARWSSTELAREALEVLPRAPEAASMHPLDRIAHEDERGRRMA